MPVGILLQVQLRATTSLIGDHVVVALDGSADLATAPRLDTELRSAIAKHPAVTLQVDLDGLTSLDDVAMGLLLGAAGSARTCGGDLVVVCSDPARRARLTIAGFDRAVAVQTSLSAPHRAPGEVAVIFTSQRTDADPVGYDAAAARMEELASARPGYLGIESARGDDGVGITVSYWRSAEHALAWKREGEHLLVQRTGRERWYEWYRVRVATVDRAYAYDATHGTGPAHHEEPMTEPSEILHLALPSDWDAARPVGEYTTSTRGRTLAEEGFIHCSYPSQLEGVANRFYRDVDELLILRVATDLLEAEVKVEPSVAGGTDLFPHVYGPIPTTAVVATTWWERDDDGAWRRPQTF